MDGRVVYKIFRTKSDLTTGKTWVGIGNNLWVDPMFPIRYMNHSCDANLGYKTPRRLYARRNIEKGEELTIDYSTVEFVENWRVKCQCGSEYCRGEMTAIQFLSREVYNSYLPYIPLFFQKIYLQYNKHL